MDIKRRRDPSRHPDYTSTEETTNEVAVEGGNGTLLAPVNTKHNTSSQSPLSFHYSPGLLSRFFLALKHILTSNRPRLPLRRST